MSSRVRILTMVLGVTTRFLDSMFVTMWEYQNTKIFSQRATHQINQWKTSLKVHWNFNFSENLTFCAGINMEDVV